MLGIVSAQMAVPPLIWFPYFMKNLLRFVFWKFLYLYFIHHNPECTLQTQKGRAPAVFVLGIVLHASAKTRTYSSQVASTGSSVKKIVGHYWCYCTLLGALLYSVLNWLLWPREVTLPTPTAGTVQCSNWRKLSDRWSVGTEIFSTLFLSCHWHNWFFERCNSFLFQDFVKDFHKENARVGALLSQIKVLIS